MNEMAADSLEEVITNCAALTIRGSETVEYEIEVKYHVQGCGVRMPSCECPTKPEKRVRSRTIPPLLEQLQKFQENKDVDRNPKAARGAPRVKTPKMHPELRGFFVLDELTCEIYMFLDRMYQELNLDRSSVAFGLEASIVNAVNMAKSNYMERPDAIREFAKASRKWVYKARAALNQYVSDAQFADTVCGNCNGGLAVPWDNSREVRCIGTPTEPPCGETYPMSEWVSLYEKGRTNA